MKTKNFLLIDDDAMIASGLVYALEQEGYIIVHGKSVSEARSAAYRKKTREIERRKTAGIILYLKIVSFTVSLPFYTIRLQSSEKIQNRMVN